MIPGAGEAALPALPALFPVHVPADVEESNTAVDAAHAVRDGRWNEFDVARFQRMRLPSDDLAVHDLAAARHHAAALDNDPDVNRLRMYQCRLGVRDPADVDVVFSAFDHP